MSCGSCGGFGASNIQTRLSVGGAKKTAPAQGFTPKQPLNFQPLDTSGGLPTWAWAAIAAGGVGVLGLVGFLVFPRKTKKGR